MRRLWTQKEIVDIGKRLGLKNFDRRSVRYWSAKGIFPEPISSVKGIISFYEDSKIDHAFVEIGRRMRIPTEITLEDVKWAKEEELKDVKVGIKI